jgi:hypothetical protein
MKRETPRAEVLRLLRELRQIRHNEIFGGLSGSERAEYDRKVSRISELELRSGTAYLSLFSEDDLNNKSGWEKNWETDSPQTLTRQPHRHREKESHDSQAEKDSPENPDLKRAITDDE